MLRHEPPEDGNEYYYIHKHTLRLAALETYVEKHWTIKQMLRSFFRGFLITLKGKFRSKILTTTIGEKTTNTKRRYKRKPFCKNGHDLTDPKNVKTIIQRGYSFRYCNACNRERSRATRLRIRLEKLQQQKEI